MAEREYKKRIQGNYTDLLKELDGVKLAEHLYQAELFDSDEEEEVSSGKTRKEKNKLFLRILSQSKHGHKAYDKFLETLKNEGYRHVAQKLDDYVLDKGTVDEAPESSTSVDLSDKVDMLQVQMGKIKEMNEIKDSHKTTTDDVSTLQSGGLKRKEQQRKTAEDVEVQEEVAEAAEDKEKDNVDWMRCITEGSAAYIQLLIPVADQVKSCMADVQQIKPVKIAIIDSGIKCNHPIFQEMPDIEKSKIVQVNVFDGSDNADDDDENGHGTAMFGVIRSIVSMVNGLVEFVIMKVTQQGQGLTQRMLYRAIQYLLSPQMEDISVVCMAHGIFEEPTPETQEAVSKLCERKVFICAVSNDGNWDPENIAYPAGEAIGVGSCDEFGCRSNFTPRGRDLFCLGTGEHIETLNSNWEGDGCFSKIVSGTSVATAWVSSAVCMCLLPLQRQEFVGTDWPEKLKKTRYTKNLLRLMARDNKFTAEEGYGVIDPRKIFKDFDSYFAAVFKACTNNK